MTGASKVVPTGADTKESIGAPASNDSEKNKEPSISQYEYWKTKIGKHVTGKPFQAVIYFGLFIALFGLDFYAVADVDDAYNEGMYIVLTIVFVLFMIEIVLQSWCFTEEYLDHGVGFYFWTDLVGTISMIFDVPWLSPLTQGSGNGETSILRASKAAKVGARVARLLKLTRAIKMMKAMRVQSLLKAVADVVTEQISRNVAMLVMSMAIIVPLFNMSEQDGRIGAMLNSYEALGLEADFDPSSKDFETNFINLLWKTDVGTSGDAVPYRVTYTGGTTPLVWLSPKISDISMRREQNTMTAKSLNGNFTCAYDISSLNELNGWINITMVFIVVIMLMLFSTILHRVVMKGVIEPMERIFSTINDAMQGAFDMDADEENGAKLTTAKALEESVAKLARILKARERNAMDDALSKGDKEQNKWILQNTSHNFRNANDKNPKKQKKRGKSTTGRSSIVAYMDGAQESIDALGRKSMLFMHGNIRSPQDALDTLDTWDYNCFDYDETTLIQHAANMICLMQFGDTFLIDEATIFRFTRKIGKQYLDNTYHNFRHGVDVMQSVFFISRQIDFESHLSMLEMFATLSAALSHDVGHPGVTNAFLVNTGAPLAMRYNDISVLENLHASIMFDTMGPFRDTNAAASGAGPDSVEETGKRNNGCNLWSGLSEQDWITARKTAIKVILATDNSHHFKCINDMKVMLELHSAKLQKGVSSIFAETEKHRLFLCSLLLHVSDISNPFRNWKASSTAANKIMEEFFQQGDKEKALSMSVSMLCDREKENIAKAQIGFIDFFITPLAEQFLKLFPEMGSSFAGNLCSNRLSWQTMYLDELAPAERAEEEPKYTSKFRSFEKKFQTWVSTTPPGVSLSSS